MKYLFKKISFNISLVLIVNIFIQGDLYGRRIRGNVLPANVNDYLRSISNTDQELRERSDQLSYWIDRYSDHRVRWNTMPFYIMRSFIELAADSLGKDSFMFRKSDFMEHLDIFGGKTLSGILNFFKNEEGSNDIWVMRQELGIMPIELDEWILFCRDSETSWEHMPNEIKAGFIRKAAEELEKDIWELVESDFSHSHFDFLNGKTMAGLPNYFIELFKSGLDNTQRVLPSLTEEDFRLDNIYCIFKGLGLLPQSDQEWIKYVAIRRIQWAEIPLEVKEILVKRMAEELSKEPYQLKAADFDEPLDFLNGKELSGLFNSYDANIYKLKIGLGILKTSDDWIQFIREFRIRWESVPLDIQRALVVRAAQELGKRVYQLEQEDFTDVHFDFLGGKCLVALLIHHNNRVFDIRENLNLMPEDYNEWLDKIRTAKSMAYWWQRIPDQIRYMLVQDLALSLGKVPSNLVHGDFYLNVSMFNNKNLNGLLSLYNGIDDLRDSLIGSFEAGSQYINPRWEAVPLYLQRLYIIHLLAYLGKDLEQLSSGDFYVNIPSLGRALIGMLNHYGDVLNLKEKLHFDTLN